MAMLSGIRTCLLGESQRVDNVVEKVYNTNKKVKLFMTAARKITTIFLAAVFLCGANYNDVILVIISLVICFDDLL